MMLSVREAKEVALALSCAQHLLVTVDEDTGSGVLTSSSEEL